MSPRDVVGGPGGGGLAWIWGCERCFLTVMIPTISESNQDVAFAAHCCVDHTFSTTLSPFSPYADIAFPFSSPSFVFVAVLEVKGAGGADVCAISVTQAFPGCPKYGLAGQRLTQLHEMGSWQRLDVFIQH